MHLHRVVSLYVSLRVTSWLSFQHVLNCLSCLFFNLSFRFFVLVEISVSVRNVRIKLEETSCHNCIHQQVSLISFRLVVKKRGFIGAIFHISTKRACDSQVITSCIENYVDWLTRYSQFTNVYCSCLILSSLKWYFAIKS